MTWPNMDESDPLIPLRILSIDGGGLKGAMPAAFLATLEEKTGERVVDHFDLIVGTSTGGIIALGLGLGLPASTILTFYQEKGPAIFGQLQDPKAKPLPQRFWTELKKCGRKAKQVLRSKYDPSKLRTELEAILGTQRLGDSQTRLVIPAWHSVRRTPYLFKTAHHPRLEVDYKEKAVDVAMATAAAPTYMPAHQLESGVMLADGGIWANNPTGVAAVEAAAMLKWPMEKVNILSLGCTTEHFVVDTNAGLASFGLKGGLEMMFQGQSFGALSTAKLLLGGGAEALQRICRIDVTVPKDFADMDDATRITELAGLGCAEAREHLPLIREKFLVGIKSDFQPCHTLEESTIQ